MKFSAGVVLALLVSPASTFVQRPSLVFQTQRPTFRQTSNHRSSQLQAVEIANIFTAIAADPEVATAAANSLGLLDVAVFLVPLAALAAGASAISQRDLIRSEIDTTERTLAETKALLEKSDQTIKISFATAAATFALAFAYELGVISIPETTSVSSSSDVNTVTKTQQVSETKAPSKIASPKPAEPPKTKAEVKTEKPKPATDLRAVPPLPAVEKGPDNYDALFDKLTAPKDEEKVESKEAVVDPPKEKEEVSEQPKEGVVDSLLPKTVAKPQEEAIVETKEEAAKEMPKEVIPEQIKEQGGVVNSLMSKVSDAKDSPKESKTETPKEKEGVVDSLMSKLSENTKEETPQEPPKAAAIEPAKPSEELKEATKESVTELPKAEAAKPETQEVKKVETKPVEEEVKKTPEQKPTEAAKDTPKDEPKTEETKKTDVVPAPVKIVARAPDLEPAKGGGVVESLMQRLNEKQKDAKVEDVKPKEAVEVKPKAESTKEAPVKDKAPEQPKATPAPKEPATKETVAPKVEQMKETVKAKSPEPPKPLIAPKVEKAKEDVKDSKAAAPKESAKQVAVSSKTASQPAAAPAFDLGDSQMVVAGVAVASIGLAAILIGSGDDNGSSPSPSQPVSSQASSSPPSGPPQKPPSVPKPFDASYLNSLTREETALKNKGQVRGSYLDVIDDTSASARLKGKKSMNSPYLESLPNIKLNSVPAGQVKVPPPAKMQQPPPPPQPRPESQRPQAVPEVRQAIPPPPQATTQQAVPPQVQTQQAMPPQARTQQPMPPQPAMPEPKAEPQNLSPEPRANSGGYLGALSNTPGMPPPGPKKSFSPMGRKYNSATSGTGASSYLDNMSSRTFSQPPSYNSPPQNTPPPSNASFDPNGSLGRGMSSPPPGPQFGSSPGSSPNAPISPSGPPPPARPAGPIKNFSQMGRRYTASQSGTGVGSYLDNISPSEGDNRTN
ncbi:hypothetical protein FisN_6Hh380 [Fistulifera solaris]|uniref:Uncharacterized protein n=1 Tax=Fistulifera solaris TaxID=1519565 RepID=A0A1Z5K7Q9_FISSO|nr:hypothetical protein FisN_6Hh380 [Fistulifera solaris]|eukprot:GAX22131.1 hypothetical protein FisN_6Hh380 [Fistulifera solaris]